MPSSSGDDAATKYKRVVAVISKPPSLRKDFEVNNLISWFRKQSRLFASLKTEMVFDVIKNLSFISRVRDDVLIKEGDRGDCMYITLRGKSSIYRLSEDAKAANQASQSSPAAGAASPAAAAGSATAAAGDTESIRTQLGDHLVTLGRDAVFGDVALMSEDCIRTASVIVDEPSDYIVVDRELYDRSVKSVLKKEFEDKTNFIESCPFFKSWMPRYRKQLAMAMQKECYPYEAIITKQGDAVDNIYFILLGEVKVIMDTQGHRSQYAKLLSKYSDPMEQTGDDGNSSSRDSAGQQRPSLSARKRPQSAVKRLNEVCLLGVNESVGDMEVLLDLPSYMQTAVCTQRCEVLTLELKHFERLFVKRHPRTVDQMKDSVTLRVKSRTSVKLIHSIPLLRCLLDLVDEHRKQKTLQSQVRQITK